MNTYEIRIQSLLDPAWQETFNIESFTHDKVQRQTLLSGTLDQSQLQGLLNRIHDMGLKLIEVKLIDSGQ